MARALIVGCGCRGQALTRALIAEGHVVRGTTRDPDRLATMMGAIEGTSVVCWLMGTAGPGQAAEQLHGPRLDSMLEHIVDTPVRGLVYETGGQARPEGVAAARRATTTYGMPVEILE